MWNAHTSPEEGSDSAPLRVKEGMGSLKNKVSENIRNLGVNFDQAMHLDTHIKSVTRTCFFHLRNIAKIKSIVSHSDLEKIIHALVSSRIDYSNSVLTSLNKSSIDRLQLIQNSAARLLTRSSRRCHITPVLASLHWLPVAFRVQFKVLTLTFRALHGQAPDYLIDLLTPYVPSRALRSADQGLLVIPRTKMITKGDRAFQSVAPKLWNALPCGLRTAASVDIFKKQLKTFLFQKAFGNVGIGIGV